MSGAHVVLQADNDTGSDGVSISRVFVNGVDVGTLTAAPKVRVGANGTRTTVTLTLEPAYIEIKGENRPAEKDVKPFGFTGRRDDGKR